jgi:ATP:ADP antiporter, AAA family
VLERERLLTLLDVRAGEARLVGRLLALYFVLIAAVVLIQSMAFGLFIAEYGARSLPYAYLAIAALASLIAFAYLRIGALVSFGRLLSLNLTFLAVGSLLLWAALATPAARVAIFLLPVWFQVFVTLANLAVWPLALRLFDVRQSKRVFGLIGAGNWLANILGGLVVAPLVRAIGPTHLLALAALVVVAAWALLRLVLRDHPDAAAPAPAQAARREPGTAPRFGRYATLIFGYVAFWWLAFYFVDNIFYGQAAGQYPDAAQITAFIGRFLSVTGAVALVTTVVLTSRILRRFGLRAGLLTMPAIVTAIIAAVAVGGSLGLPVIALFWLATAGKLFNVALGFSLSQTSNTVMYQALVGRERERVQTVAEGIVQPVAIGVAGAMLLALTALGGLGTIGLAWVLLPIALVWLLLTAGVARAYPAALAQVVARRRWGAAGTTPLDATGELLLRQHLTDPHPGAVLYALERLGEQEIELDPSDLTALLGHPALEVRAAVLRRLEARGAAGLVAALEARLGEEREPALRAAVLRALSSSGAAGALATVASYLDAQDPTVRAGALTGLLRQGAEGERAELALSRLTASSVASERVLAADVLGAVGSERGEEGLRALLSDADPEVRRAAIDAVCGRPGYRLWPQVIAAGDSPGTARAVERALASGGDDAFDAIEAAAADPDLPPAMVVVVARACGRAGGPRAVQVLTRLREVPVAAVQVEVLRALTSVGYRQADRAAHRHSLEACRERMVWIEQTLALLDEAPAAPLLESALADAWRRERDMILLHLSHVADATSVLAAREALLRAEPVRAAQALEVLDARLPADLRHLVLPWLEASLEVRRRPERTIAGVRPLLAARVEALIAGPDATWFGAWPTACALYAVGAAGFPAADAVLAVAEDAGDPLIAATARWARRHRTGAPVEREEGAMLSSLERVVILKTVPIFEGTPDAVLADVGDALDEFDVAAGETIIRQGDEGDSMYVVVDGRVRVHDGDRTLDELGEREVFGEMALLDPEPRVASVSALEPTRLLRLPHGPFHELLHERPEIAIAIMRVLTQRLRDRIGDLAALAR